MNRLAVVLTALVLAGCSGTSTEPSGPPVHYTEPPLPARAEPAVAPSATPDRNPTCTDPTASLRPAPERLAARGPALDAIRARGRLVVGLDTGSNLFSFRDPVTGRIEGFDVDIAKEVARDLFGDRERVEFRILGSADREAALEGRLVDIVVKTMTITCERRKRVSFSTVYYQASQRVLTMSGSGISGIEDLAGKRVCIVKGTTSLQRMQQMQPAAAILTVPYWADCLVVLQQRQVDAISTDDAILAGLAAQDPYLEVVGEPISDEPYGVGVPKGNDDVVRFVNNTLERVRVDGTWNTSYTRWLSVLGPSPGPPPPRYED